MRIIDITHPPQSLWIGREGENTFRPVSFECANWFSAYPNATIAAYYQPYGASDPYPLVLTVDGTKRIWHPLLAELVKGDGELQIVLMNGETVGTSAIIPAKVDRSLISNADHSADEAPSWTVQVVQDVTQQADRAEEASEHYPQIRNGYWWVWDVESGEWVNTGVKAQGEGGTAADAVLYTPQTLTDAQQAQTRSNIGIEYMTEEDIEEMWGDVLPSDEFTKLSDLMQKCRLVTDSSPNLWNPDTVQVGLVTVGGNVYTGGSYDNYEYNLVENVSPGDVIRTYNFMNDGRVVVSNFSRITAFDANGTAVTSKGTNTAANTFTVPDGISSLWVCFSGHTTRMVIVNDSAVPTEYIPYGTDVTYYVATEEFLPVENFTVNLPSDLYALVGYELNVYFENLVEDWTKYDFNVNCDKGMQLERGYRITPTADDVGNYTLSITISNGKDSTTVSTTLHVIAASANSGVTKTVMVLGDSTTNNGIAVTKLNENFANDVMHISLVGTRGTSPNLHEGRSGWKFSSYFNPPNAGDVAAGVENPWYNPTTQTFDAAYYFENADIVKPDWLFINLGINDVFGYDNDASLNTQIGVCKSLCDDMIASIKSASPSTQIGLCLTIPPNHSQDAFGKAYKCGQTRNRYKRNNLLWVSALIEEYDNRQSDGIYLIPIYTNLDTVYNMGMETLPVNARNTDVTYQSPILNGGVHPVLSGYWQIADVYTAFLKGVE